VLVGRSVVSRSEGDLLLDFCSGHGLVGCRVSLGSSWATEVRVIRVLQVRGGLGTLELARVAAFWWGGFLFFWGRR
jgi:hypothetical protein